MFSRRMGGIDKGRALNTGLFQQNNRILSLRLAQFQQQDYIAGFQKTAYGTNTGDMHSCIHQYFDGDVGVLVLRNRQQQ